MASAYSIRSAADETGLSSRDIETAIENRELIARRHTGEHRDTLIVTAADLEAWMHRLPEWY